MSERGNVPCAGCTLCCRSRDAIVLFPDMGDDPDSYDTIEWTLPGNSLSLTILKQNKDGSCVYLKDGGCSIHKRRPAVCRSFDCRDMYASMTRAERKAMVARGLASKAVFDRGRELLSTLDRP